MVIENAEAAANHCLFVRKRRIREADTGGPQILWLIETPCRSSRNSSQKLGIAGRNRDTIGLVSGYLSRALQAIAFNGEHRCADHVRQGAAAQSRRSRVNAARSQSTLKRRHQSGIESEWIEVRDVIALSVGRSRVRITYSQNQTEFWRCPPGILSVGFKIVEAELASGHCGVLSKAIEVPEQRVGKGIAGGVGAAGGGLSADHTVRGAGCPGEWTETEGTVVGCARVLRLAV